MSRSLHRLAAMVAALTSAAIIETAAAETHSPEEIAAARADGVRRLFDADEAEPAAGERRLCFLGKQPQKVAQDRAEGAYFMPDPADTCIAALTRFGRDRQLEMPYRELVDAIGGDPGIVAGLPGAIGAAVTHDQSTIPLGNGKGAALQPAMAFDAGFTVAYKAAAAVPTENIDLAKLRAGTEGCLGEEQPARLCFSIGYVQGTLAYRQQLAAAH